MSAKFPPLPQIRYKKEHDGAWIIYRGNDDIGRIYRELESQEQSVMLDGLQWTREDRPTLTRGVGAAVLPVGKRQALRIICLQVAFALRELEMRENPAPAVEEPPRVKPKITIDLEEPRDPPQYEMHQSPAPAKGLPTSLYGVQLSRAPATDRVRMDVGFGHVFLEPKQARAAWVLLGEYLGEARQAPDGGTIRNGGISYPSDAMKARQAVHGGLETMWRMSFSTDPTEADLKRMAGILREM